MGILGSKYIHDLGNKGNYSLVSYNKKKIGKVYTFFRNDEILYVFTNGFQKLNSVQLLKLLLHLLLQNTFLRQYRKTFNIKLHLFLHNAVLIQNVALQRMF